MSMSTFLISSSELLWMDRKKNLRFLRGSVGETGKVRGTKKWILKHSCEKRHDREM